jgi:hypothetical protein
MMGVMKDGRDRECELLCFRLPRFTFFLSWAPIERDLPLPL